MPSLANKQKLANGIMFDLALRTSEDDIDDSELEAILDHLCESCDIVTSDMHVLDDPDYRVGHDFNDQFEAEVDNRRYMVVYHVSGETVDEFPRTRKLISYRLQMAFESVVRLHHRGEQPIGLATR